MLTFHKYVTIYSVVRIKKKDKTSFRFYSWCLHLKYEWWQFFLYCLCLCHLEDNTEVSIKTGIPGEQTAIIIKNDPIRHENKADNRTVSIQDNLSLFYTTLMCLCNSQTFRLAANSVLTSLF